MPALTRASFLSVNPKRGEPGESGGRIIRRLIHELLINTLRQLCVKCITLGLAGKLKWSISTLT